jgi:hypothetical protein
MTMQMFRLRQRETSNLQSEYSEGGGMRFGGQSALLSCIMRARKKGSSVWHCKQYSRLQLFA